jgi:hypothetical protein
MKRTDCFQSFAQGAEDRSGRPLPTGEYKLRELHYALDACHRDSVRIREFMTHRRPWAARSCTREDKHIWLKRLPGWVAYWLGYSFLPSVQALGFDGVPENTVSQLYRRLVAPVEKLVEELEVARQSLNPRIGSEYERMRRGNPTLEPLLLRSVELCDEALTRRS